MPPQVILDLRGPRGRVDRHGHTAREQDAEEAEKIFMAGRQHDRHRLAGLQLALQQPRRDLLRAVAQRGIGQRELAAFRIQQREVLALRVGAHMPVQYFRQRQRIRGFGLHMLRRFGPCHARWLRL